MTTKCSNNLNYNDKNNIKIISDIDHNNYNTLRTTLQFVSNLLRTDIVTCRAAIRAKITKYDYKMF